MKNRTVTLLALLTAGCLTVSPVQAENASGAKIIDLSWSNPSVDYYVKNLKTLEEHAPVDGLVIRFYGTPRMVNGKNFRPGPVNIMGRIPWKYEDFRDAIAKMKSVRSSKFTDNFLYTTATPGDADWFSDDDWKCVINNYALAARIAKETGMKGLIIDIEPYKKHFWSFGICTGKHSLAESCRIARERGREWGKAVFSAFPEGVYFFPHFLEYAGAAEPLVVPFLDGMYDVLPPQTIIVDGQEFAGYRAHREGDYDRAFRRAHRTDAHLLSPENRRKHRAQTRFAPGFYMDAVFQICAKRYNDALKPEIGMGKIPFFGSRLLYALERADGYIWLYSERGCWWPKSERSDAQTTWEKRAPGMSKLVELIRNPDSFSIEESGKKSLIQSSEWNFWKQGDDDPKKGSKSIGSGSISDGILQISGVSVSGCFHRSLPVVPGEIYLLRAQFRAEKELNGNGSLSVCYMDGKKNWMKKRHSLTFKPEKPDEWVTGTLLIAVPENAATASFQLGVCGQRPGDTVSFRNVSVIQVVKQ